MVQAFGCKLILYWGFGVGVVKIINVVMELSSTVAWEWLIGLIQHWAILGGTGPLAAILQLRTGIGDVRGLFYIVYSPKLSILPSDLLE